MANNYRPERDRFAIGGELIAWRDRMVKIAALAVAAIESHDRTYNVVPDTEEHDA